MHYKFIDKNLGRHDSNERCVVNKAGSSSSLCFLDELLDSPHIEDSAAAQLFWREHVGDIFMSRATGFGVEDANSVRGPVGLLRSVLDRRWDQVAKGALEQVLFLKHLHL